MRQRESLTPFTLDFRSSNSHDKETELQKIDGKNDQNRQLTEDEANSDMQQYTDRGVSAWDKEDGEVLIEPQMTNSHLKRVTFSDESPIDVPLRNRA